MARLQDFYKAEVAPALMKKFNYKSPMQIPRFDKIVINVGAGEAKDNAKVIDAIIADVTAITGQKAVPTHAKKSVANFKIRQGMTIGVKVTLRGSRMYEFMDRLFNLALPRVRDFKGCSTLPGIVRDGLLLYTRPSFSIMQTISDMVLRIISRSARKAL